MRIVSVNCSKIQTVSWKGKSVRTAIFKTPVSKKVAIRRLGLEEDRQADLRYHGGADKAVYSYDLHDYRWWSRELNRELAPGAFGENLTTEGMLDREVCAGDIFRAGTATLQAVQPRIPCYKLGVKFQDDQMPKRFMSAERWGIYFRVLEEGLVEAGDAFELIEAEPNRVPVGDLVRILRDEEIDPDLVRRALAIPSLNSDWRQKLQRMAELQQEDPIEKRAG